MTKVTTKQDLNLGNQPVLVWREQLGKMPLLTVSQAADWLGVSTQALNSLIAAGRMYTYKVGAQEYLTPAKMRSDIAHDIDE